MKKLLILLVAFLQLNAVDAFISPNQLKERLQSKDLVLIDVGTEALYKKSHITGALHLDVTQYYDAENATVLIDNHELMQTFFKEMGINSTSRVVLYSHNTDKGLLYSSYMALALIANGFENVSLLDGGYMAWVFEHELLTSTAPREVQHDGNFTISYNPNIIVTTSYLKENLGISKILDARSPALYFGTLRSKNVSRLGHIATASSAYYKNNFLTDTTLRPKEDLQDIYFKGYQLSVDSEVIVYANNILKASINWYIIYQYLHIENAKIYAESLQVWTDNSELPMTRFKWE